MNAAGGGEPLWLRTYRRALYVLPGRVRRASGPGMEDVLFDLYTIRRATRGRLAAWILLVRGFLELLSLAVTTRFEDSATGRPPRRETMIKRLPPALDSLRANLQFARRSLLREPGYAVAFVITLCLGIGVNTATFSVVNGVLLRPLPYPEADRLVFLSQPAEQRGSSNIQFSLIEVEDLRSRSQMLEELVEFGDIDFIVQAGDGAYRATGGLVTPNFFAVLGMRAQLGRTLHADDFGDGAAPVAVLTHEYWERAHGGDPSAVGGILDLTGERAEIVGVLAPGAHYATVAGRQDFYVNYAADEHYRSATMQGERAHRMTTVFGRLAADATLDQANAELQQIAAAFGEAYPEDYPVDWGLSLQVTPWKEQITGEARPTLLLLLATAGIALFAACANVANLTLMRVARREGELAVRAAMGAGRARLRWLLLSESLLLTLTGAAGGLLVAWAGIDVLVAYVSRFTVRTGEIGIDARVLGFTTLVAVIAASAFALLPGLGAGPQNLATASGSSRATSGGRRRHAQRGLVICQFAMAFVLLVAAGLMLRTLMNLYQVDPGFDLENVLRVDASKFGWRSNRADGIEERRQFSDALVAELSAHPAILSGAVASSVPLAGGAQPQRFVFDGGAAEAGGSISTSMPFVSGGYFATVGVELLSGRTFDGLVDRPESTRVAVIDRTMARHYFGDVSPVGRRLGIPIPAQPTWWYTIVGVVADSKVTALQDEDVHTLYRAESQVRPPSTVLVRVRGEPGAVTSYVLDTIRRLDPERAIENVQTLAEARQEYVAPQRLNATLFGLLAGLAVAIAAVGIAGTLSFFVSQRRREIGVRVALGADRGNVLGLVVREGAVLAALGMGIGLVVALLLSTSLSSFLFDVRPADPMTLVATAVLLSLVGIGASLVPARHAVRIDPIEALRGD